MQALKIRTIKATESAMSDTLLLTHLLPRIAQDEPIASFGAHRASVNRACHAAIAERGVAAVIPARRTRTFERQVLELHVLVALRSCFSHSAFLRP